MGKFRITQSQYEELCQNDMVILKDDIVLYKVDTLTYFQQIAVLVNIRTDRKELVSLVVE